ncbi:aspartate-semialdehyde dehydrogenase [Mucisphaera calidilacus]|uniref:Aspartate-semialdehyde dehydrogenase n=1 Tax=Mucisphaera calidilacus TaxID=2527982 RepID=A0A518BV86_9BACT|nr:aspartate-semialdehyde dehydrogenase [Mucisphaera calidilacus]QDU70886.1 Aspartate-semialdehyde dehydrogenase 2 [Mucisphaera calidilacus]
MPASNPAPSSNAPASSATLNVAIAGATGAVGQEFLRVLEQRNFPINELRLLASSRSAGKSMTFAGKDLVVRDLAEETFEGIDVALFSAGGGISKQFAQKAVDAGAIVIDNSSAFRMTPGVPLVVPEVNPEAMADIAIGSKPGIIANPNCSTIIALVAVTPIHRAAGVKRMVVSTYQAASGAGAAAMAELELQTREVLEGKPPTCEIFDRQYAFNVFSHNSDIGPEGYNTEEMKLVRETHKIWNQPEDQQTAITATCVRVPVLRAHSEAINLTLDKPLTEQQALAIFEEAPGISIIDDRDANRFPTPLDASDRDDVYVGRIRTDISQPGNTGLDIFICGDQIRKGAALNAVQIAEQLL